MQSLTSEVHYVIDLIRGGWNGAVDARKANAALELNPSFASTVWTSAAVGAAVGVWSTSSNRDRRSASSLALGGLIGSALGIGCGLTWASRGYTRALVRNAARRINDVRDAHWIEKNPIDYA